MLYPNEVTIVRISKTPKPNSDCPSGISPSQYGKGLFISSAHRDFSEHFIKSTSKTLTNDELVQVVGLEPTRLKPADFETALSTIPYTPACGRGDRTRTGTHISARDFKSRVATITPLPHLVAERWNRTNFRLGMSQLKYLTSRLQYIRAL